MGLGWLGRQREADRRGERMREGGQRREGE